MNLKYMVHEAYDYKEAKKTKYVNLWCKPNSNAVYLYNDDTVNGEGRVGVVEDEILYKIVDSQTKYVAQILNPDKDACGLQVDVMESNPAVELALKDLELKKKQNKAFNKGCLIATLIIFLVLLAIAC